MCVCERACVCVRVVFVSVRVVFECLRACVCMSVVLGVVLWCGVLSRACWSLSSSLFTYCCDYST